MIAREHVLTRRDLLDTLGRPERLLSAPSPDVDRLARIARAVLAELPPDLAARLPEPAEGDDGMVGMFDADSGVLLALKELVGPDGSVWVSAACGTLYRGAEEAAGGLPESVNVLVNRLNVTDAGSAWTTSTVGDERTVVRLCGSARPLDEGSATWFRLVGYLLATAFAASERGREDVGPGTSFVDLLSRADDVEGFSADELVEAAVEFRDSFPPDLARVVMVEEAEDGVGVTIPFRADGDVHALSALFTVTAPGDSGAAAPGLRVIAGFYENMRTRDAYRWARSFNGDDDTPESGDAWDQTTPWLFGSWQVLELEGDSAAVVYRGLVPAALKEHTSAADAIRGVMRESWVSANRYRLRREFDETVRTGHGDV